MQGCHEISWKERQVGVGVKEKEESNKEERKLREEDKED